MWLITMRNQTNGRNTHRNIRGDGAKRGDKAAAMTEVRTMNTAAFPFWYKQAVSPPIKEIMLKYRLSAFYLYG
jgi:hypothetical protein